mgnify:CR=1 FL=1
MNRGSSQDLQRSVEAESNLQDVANLIGSLHRNKEPLLHCAVYIEMIAGDMQELQILQTNVEVELMRSKLNVDRLKLRQQAGFCAVSPVGFNVLGTEYERVLPASSVANLFPFNYSGKTDRKGFYIGKDKYGTRPPSHGKNMKSLSANTWEELFIQRTMDMTATMTMFCLQTQEN